MHDAINDLTRCLVFTDLDGSLLDHDNYSFDAAKPMLHFLFQQSIAVIPNTSKTFAELVALRHDIGIENYPFIVENGACVYIPNVFIKACSHSEDVIKQAKLDELENEHGLFYYKAFTSKREQWQSILSEITRDYKEAFLLPDGNICFDYYANMTAEMVQNLTELSLKQTYLSMQRDFSEPVYWRGTDEQKQYFLSVLESKGAKPLEGGRFIHVMSDCDKGKAMQWLCSFISKLQPELKLERQQSFYSIALGDSQNDEAMLNKADIAVCIKAKNKPYPSLKRSEKALTNSVIYTDGLGPVGWNEALKKVFNVDNLDS